LAKIWLPWQRALEPCHQKCILQIGGPQKLAVISYHIVVVSHRNAFIDILVQKLVVMVTSLDISYTTEVMGVFVIFLPILVKIWLPRQRPLDPCNQKCLLWIGRPRKPAVKSNQIITISRINFSPKVGCHGNAVLFLVYGSITDEFADSTNTISNQTLYVPYVP